ncbi:MAG: flavin-dependent dehydrogenase [Cyanobacteria bacterium P01_H01_bin.15]
MRELLYLEVPTPKVTAVCDWLHHEWQPPVGKKSLASDGLRITLPGQTELVIAVWSLQRTTYLKVFSWQESGGTVSAVLQSLKRGLDIAYPLHYQRPPETKATDTSIFETLSHDYPETVRYFQKMPRGEYDLNRVYWWEKRWREQVQNPSIPQVIISKAPNQSLDRLDYDIIYVGGALGSIHAAAMAQRGYRVLVIERLGFGRMNREWNISRDEFQTLIDLGLFTKEEFESFIAREYQDGFSKFHDANLPASRHGETLHTPTVLNIALDTSSLLAACGHKLTAAGGEIWDETEFLDGQIAQNGVEINVSTLLTGQRKCVTGRILIDAMGTASPIAWQLNGRRTFDSVCPTVGAVIEGLAPEVWDSKFGDVLHSHGDICRGRQLIWELFPGSDKELTVYLFHYHQVHPDNPGSLLEMYEDFFSILTEYRRCDLADLTWKKPTFGYIPGYYSTSGEDRQTAFDRLMAIGDSASLQSPLIFTGFGSLVRNLQRLTVLLETALTHDLLQAEHLSQIRAYQSNVSVTWLFSKGMMVPTGQTLPPARINEILNTFFGLLSDEPPAIADQFIKDRTDWWTFTRLALKAARKQPLILPWIYQMAGLTDCLRWVWTYLLFSLDAFKNLLFVSWFPQWLERAQPWLEEKYPAWWLKALSFRFSLRKSGLRFPLSQQT